MIPRIPQHPPAPAHHHHCERCGEPMIHIWYPDAWGQYTVAAHTEHGLNGCTMRPRQTAGVDPYAPCICPAGTELNFNRAHAYP